MVLAASLLLLGHAIVLPSAQASALILTVEAHFASARQAPSAVWDGQAGYFFGGHNSASGNIYDIVRYLPGSGQPTLMNSSIVGGPATAAVWTGSVAYIFGGQSNFPNNNVEIQAFHPANDTIETVGALPVGLGSSSAVWTGTYVFLFGGYTSAGQTDAIVRFDPSTREASTMGGRLPNATYGAAAVWDGTHAYVFGGRESNVLDTIVEYDPASDTAVDLAVHLPAPRGITSAVWTGDRAIIFGGRSGPEAYYDDAVIFDPANMTVETSPSLFPTARMGTAALWSGQGGLVAGGVSSSSPGDFQVYDEIFRIAVPPSAPRNLTASDGGPHNITLNWTAPSGDGGTPVTNHRIYRGNSTGTETFLTEVGNVLTYTDTGLPNGATRYYKVTAKNLAGEGPFSSEAHATTCNTTFQTLPNGVRVEVCIIL